MSARHPHASTRCPTTDTILEWCSTATALDVLVSHGIISADERKTLATRRRQMDGGNVWCWHCGDPIHWNGQLGAWVHVDRWKACTEHDVNQAEPAWVEQRLAAKL